MALFPVNNVVVREWILRGSQERKQRPIITFMLRPLRLVYVISVSIKDDKYG